MVKAEPEVVFSFFFFNLSTSRLHVQPPSYLLLLLLLLELISSRPIDRDYEREMESISERTIVTGIHKNEYHKGFHQSRGYSPHLPVTAHKIPRLIYAPTLEATAISASVTFDATFDESRLSFSTFLPRGGERRAKEEIGRQQLAGNTPSYRGYRWGAWVLRIKGAIILARRIRAGGNNGAVASSNYIKSHLTFPCPLIARYYSFTAPFIVPPR